MNSNKRPISITILACVYLAIGALTFAAHFHELLARQQDAGWVELTEFTAVLCGIFLLRGHNWARWLALAWIAFHVVLSAFHAIPEFVIHSVFCVAIAWLLFRPAAAQYFRDGGSEAT
ncbi:MAG TPA: hypothetical protein VGM02_05660 [Acidobacteriaceae bacterium]|jgi:hypothetical protein